MSQIENAGNKKNCITANYKQVNQQDNQSQANIQPDSEHNRSVQISCVDDKDKDIDKEEQNDNDIDNEVVKDPNEAGDNQGESQEHNEKNQQISPVIETKSFWTKKKLVCSIVSVTIVLGTLGILLYFLVPREDVKLKKGDVKKYTLNSQSCVQISSANDTYCYQSQTNATMYVAQSNQTHAKVFISVDNISVPDVKQHVNDSNTKPEELKQINETLENSLGRFLQDMLIPISPDCYQDILPNDIANHVPLISAEIVQPDSEIERIGIPVDLSPQIVQAVLPGLSQMITGTSSSGITTARRLLTEFKEPHKVDNEQYNAKKIWSLDEKTGNKILTITITPEDLIGEITNGNGKDLHYVQEIHYNEQGEAIKSTTTSRRSLDASLSQGNETTSNIFMVQSNSSVIQTSSSTNKIVIELLNQIRKQQNLTYIDYKSINETINQQIQPKWTNDTKEAVTQKRILQQDPRQMYKAKEQTFSSITLLGNTYGYSFQQIFLANDQKSSFINLVNVFLTKNIDRKFAQLYLNSTELTKTSSPTFDEKTVEILLNSQQLSVAGQQFNFDVKCNVTVGFKSSVENIGTFSKGTVITSIKVQIKSLGGIYYPYKSLVGYFIDGTPLGIVHKTEVTFSRPTSTYKVQAYVQSSLTLVPFEFLSSAFQKIWTTAWTETCYCSDTSALVDNDSSTTRNCFLTGVPQYQTKTEAVILRQIFSSMPYTNYIYLWGNLY